MEASQTDQIDHLGPLDGPIYSHVGWDYFTSTDSDDDVVKINHYAIRGADVRELDFTPYDFMSPEVFAWMVDLDFPDRQALGQATKFPHYSGGPLRAHDVERLMLWTHFQKTQEAEQ